MAFAPDGGMLATASQDDTAILWKIDDPSCPSPGLFGAPLRHAGDVNAVAFAPDGHTRYRGRGPHRHPVGHQ